MAPTETQSPGNAMGRGDAEINSAAEICASTLPNPPDKRIPREPWQVMPPLTVEETR